MTDKKRPPYCIHAGRADNFTVDQITHIKYCGRCNRPLSPKWQIDDLARTNLRLLPFPYRDLRIKYQGNDYWGYYIMNNEYRVGISEEGNKDIFVTDIDEWEYA
jgi:hypothetical protein